MSFSSGQMSQTPKQVCFRHTFQLMIFGVTYVYNNIFSNTIFHICDSVILMCTYFDCVIMVKLIIVERWEPTYDNWTQI